MQQTLLNKDLRKEIVEMIFRAKEGHIPSSFSIIDIIHHLYSKVLKFDPNNPKWEERDYFILSKGHGGVALYVVLHKFGFLNQEHILSYSLKGGILGGHPDSTKVPGAEACTGSLGHGFPTAAGVALGLKIQQKPNRVYALLGDGECNEGTIWETALVAAKQRLSNLTAIIDFNGSAAQILPVDPLADKWRAFGWNVVEIDGHDENQLELAFSAPRKEGPLAVIAHTTKGKGVSFIEGHGKWHHKIPTHEELKLIFEELK
ncbi:MAG: transketolase [Chlamydiae bacterium CG10_big_fil_rev_8_21_14_0_10_42_34]|nr:MAG: transketolase [Chlamydiae bacterium CG10_big_fil_rev_8_21_14_0_10_42_34]